MEECLSILAREPECEGDEVLVSQIRFQRVCLEAIHNPWRTPDLVTGWEMPTGGEVSAQIHCLIKLLTARLEEAKRQVPEHLRENSTHFMHSAHGKTVVANNAPEIILLHQHTATTVIHELIIWTLPAPSGYQPPQVSASAMDTTPATEAAGPAAGDTSPHATRSGSSHYYRQPSVNTPVPAPPSPTLTSLPTMSGSSASSPPSRQPAPVRTLPPEALPSLLAIMSSTSAWFDTFFSITPRVMAGVSFGSWGQFGSAVQALYKLATLDLEGWDRGLALRRGGKGRLRSASDSSTSTSNAGAMQYWGITEALETMADRLARVGAEAGLYSGDVDAARALLQGGGGRPAAAVRKCRLGAGRATNFDRPTPTNTATTITMSPGATPSLSSTTTMATPTPQTVQCAPGLGSPDEDGADFFTLDLFTRAAKTMRLLLLAWAPVLEAGCGSKDGQATQQPSDLQTGASTHGQGAMGPLPRGLHAPLQVRADGIGVPDIGNNSDVHMTAGDEGSVSTFPHSRTMAQPPEEASVDPVSLPLSGQSWISTGPAPIIPPEHVQDQDSQQHHLHQQHGFGFGGEFFQLDDAWLSNMFVTWESLMK